MNKKNFPIHGFKWNGAWNRREWMKLAVYTSVPILCLFIYEYKEVREVIHYEIVAFQ